MSISLPAQSGRLRSGIYTVESEISMGERRGKKREHREEKTKERKQKREENKRIPWTLLRGF